VKAVGLMNFGGPEVLQVLRLPSPEPGPREVRIRVHAASVSPADTAFRSGAGLARLIREGAQPPFIPGLDAAGVVDGIGPDSDARLAIGDRVLAFVRASDPHGGAYAEQVIVSAASVVHAPPNVPLAAASTLIVSALTARLALDALALPAGRTVAVTGAAGSVGGYAVELAKGDGLEVVADAAPADEDLVRSLGGDVVVERGDGFAAAARAARPAGVDGLVDAAALGRVVLPAIRDGGGLAAVRPWQGPDERDIVVHPVNSLLAAADTARLQRLSEQVEQGIITLRVATIMPAEQAAAAHRVVEHGGIRGRIVLDFSPAVGS
jgi:NADPH:quinone reductase